MNKEVVSFLVRRVRRDQGNQVTEGVAMTKVDCKVCREKTEQIIYVGEAKLYLLCGDCHTTVQYERIG